MRTSSKLLILSILLTILLSSCIGAAGIQIPAAISQPGIGSEPVYVTVPPDATPTPTPFQPLPPTAVYIPSEEGFPTSTPLPPVELNTDSLFKYGESEPQPILSQPPGQMNILLLGADARPGNKRFRTDTIILLTINPQVGTVNLTSFPRDLYINLPGQGMNRINTAYFYGKIPLVMKTFQHNFGVRPDHYVVVNFSSFKRIIDSLDGLEVNVGQKLQDYRAGYFVTIPQGTVHMDADTVLWYVRSRKTSNDFARNRRQQEVLLALFQKFISMDAIRRAPEFYNLYKDNVMTDLTLADIIPLLPFTAQVASETNRIQNFFIGSGKVTGWITPGGAMVLLPNKAKVDKVIRKSQNLP
jgi:LCP family protein required for cell wall assembly